MNIVEETKVLRGIPILTCQKADNSRKPLVIISHGFTRNKEFFKKKGFLRKLAEQGYYAVALDNRLHGERSGLNFKKIVINSFGKVDLFLLRKAIKETADDITQLIDELIVLEEIDEERIALLGISMGGFIAYRSVVIDARIKVAVPIISSPFWDDIPGDISVLHDEKRIDEFIRLSKEFQPSEYLDKFYPTAILMQVGDADQHYDIQKVQSFYEDLKETYRNSPDRLDLKIYSNTKHEFKPEMWKQTLLWLEKFL